MTTRKLCVECDRRFAVLCGLCSLCHTRMLADIAARRREYLEGEDVRIEAAFRSCQEGCALMSSPNARVMDTIWHKEFLSQWARRIRLPLEPGGCWEWTGGRNYQGYGRVGMKGRGQYTSAHRYSHLRFIGPIPEGLVIDHLCRNPSCVNPAHLEAVTTRENILRGISFTARNARLTHCKREHPLSGDNVFFYKSRRGSVLRYCLTCKRERERARRHALRRIDAAFERARAVIR